MLLLKLAMPNVQVTFGIQFRVAFWRVLLSCMCYLMTTCPYFDTLKICHFWCSDSQCNLCLYCIPWQIFMCSMTPQGKVLFLVSAAVVPLALIDFQPCSIGITPAYDTSVRRH